MDYNNQNKRRENSVYEESVPAGKRKYFFDIRTTRDGDYYLTITERKKKYEGMDSVGFERHTIQIFQEDIGKFEEVMNSCSKKIRELIPNFNEIQFEKKDDYERRDENKNEGEVEDE